MLLRAAYTENGEWLPGESSYLTPGCWRGSAGMDTIGIYLLIAAILIAMLALAFRLSLFMAKRAVCKVIATFRDFEAVDYQNALPLELMGLSPRPFLSLRLFRDYRPWALQTLVQAGVVRMAFEGAYYLSEETLDANPQLQEVCRIR